MTSTAHLTVVPDPDPADAIVELIDAHVAAAARPHLVRTPAETALGRRVKQARFDAEGLPRGLHCIERV